jgi:heme exporter protein B
MNHSKVFVALLRKEVLSEWRNKYAISGILLYLLSIVMLIAFTFETTDDRTWMVMFWIAILFTSVNAVAKSFLQESEGRQYYMYTLAAPQLIILSKMVYNTLLMLLLSSIALLLYVVSLGYPVADSLSFLIAMLLGAMSFAATFSMISAIAGKASNYSVTCDAHTYPNFPACPAPGKPAGKRPGYVVFIGIERLYSCVGIDIISLPLAGLKKAC